MDEEKLTDLEAKVTAQVTEIKALLGVGKVSIKDNDKMNDVIEKFIDKLESKRPVVN